MIQNGDYDFFQNLAEVKRNSPINQRHLQQLCILSQLLLIHSLSVWMFNKMVLSVAQPAHLPIHVLLFRRQQPKCLKNRLKTKLKRSSFILTCEFQLSEDKLGGVLYRSELSS
ncbi:hypothetical protein QQF64_031628 [Cirrhinus molitorella]|uniref:Uncharacterized protein n=1 Tax=Cirrhinus molitorella TaxID=172907 RepID=A0ABR3MXJ1_9TELE